MSKERNIAFNAIINTIGTVSTFLIPLITYPYVSRVLGSENIGKIDFSHSIIQYFILVSALGISTYGIRECAKIRDDKNKLNALVSEIFSINVIMTVIVYAVFFAILQINKFISYKELLLLHSTLILFNTIGVEWLNSVFEDYLYINIRKILSQLLNLVLVFIFVRSQSDYYKYVILIVANNLFISLANWLRCSKNCKIKFVLHKKMYAHLKPIFVFFANKLAISIYVSSDITMLGFFTNDVTVGIYSIAVKIYSIVKNIIVAIYTVCIPRLSYKIGKGEVKEFKTIFSNIISFLIILVFPAVVGLIVVSKQLIMSVFSSQYEKSTQPLIILSIAIIFAVFGGIVSTVYNIPMNLEKVTLQGAILSAVLNFALNFFMIPRFGMAGAAITTVIAEATVLFYCLLRSKQIFSYLDFKLIKKSIFESMLCCAEILIVSLIIKSLVHSSVLSLILCIILSVVLFLVTLVATKNVFIYGFMIQVKNRLIKKH